MSRFTVYVLWQAPGWVAVGCALVALVWLFGLPLWLVPVGVAAFVVKDLAMYPVLRDTLQPPRGLVGARGRAVDRLAPAGHVRIGGELWRAEVTGAAVDAGAAVVVREVRGLTLRVDPAD